MIMIVGACASDERASEPLSIAGNSAVAGTGLAGVVASAGVGVAGGSGAPGSAAGEAGRTAIAGRAASGAGGVVAADGGMAGRGASGEPAMTPASGGVSGSSMPQAGTGGVGGSAGGAEAGEPGSAAGTSGTAGAAGAAGAGSKPAFVATGEPITATPRSWSWVPFPDTKCRDGSPAGLSVNLNPDSNKVVLFLEGGGGCFSADTCGALVSPANIPVGSRNPGNAGIFDRRNMDNPVGEWNFVHVPYCTGDVYLGDNDEGKVEGIAGTQHFMGRPNLKAFLNRLLPTFAKAEQVLFTGRSAGGFGAAWNSEFMQWAFGSIPVTVIDDSGPPASSKFVPQCLTDIQTTTWRLDRTTLLECGADCTEGGDTQAENLRHFAKLDPMPTIALIESDADSVIRGFFGVGVNGGKNDCKGTLDIVSPGMSVELFKQTLRDYRERVKDYPTFSTFFIENTSQHMWIGDSSFYTARSGGVRMVDWFRGVLEGKPASHLGLQ